MVGHRPSRGARALDSTPGTAGLLVESSHDLPRLSNGLKGVLVVIEPDLSIESSQKFTFHHRTGQLIEPTGISQKVEVGQHGIGFTTQLFIGALQLLPNHNPTHPKITKPLAQLLTNQPTIRSQVQQSFLLDIQPAQFLLQPPPGFPLRGLMMLQAICHPLPQRRNLLDGDAQCGSHDLDLNTESARRLVGVVGMAAKGRA